MPLDRHHRSPLTLILAVTDLALAAVLIAEPITRVSSPSFTAARQVMPMWAWGDVLFVLAGIVLAASLTRHDPAVPLVAAGAWHGFFAAALIVAAVNNPHAAITGCVVYVSRVVFHLLAAWTKGR